jgi:LacI family gluconate utilization system Gnt-I transcriptional repressor
MHSAEGRRRLLGSGIPVVETWDLTPTPIDMLVGFSHGEVGRSVALYLHAKGHQRLGVVSGDDERACRRSDAFCAAARTLGLAPVAVVQVATPTTLQRGRDGLAQLLALQPAVDAVFCSSDLLALGVMTEARVRGLGVPGQLAVVGFGDLEFAGALEPALTTVHIKGAAIGRQAATFIVDRAEGRDVPQRVVDIGFSIVERQSA